MGVWGGMGGMGGMRGLVEVGGLGGGVGGVEEENWQRLPPPQRWHLLTLGGSYLGVGHRMLYMSMGYPNYRPPLNETSQVVPGPPKVSFRGGYLEGVGQGTLQAGIFIHT